jgi:hypothetical protein
MYHFSAMDYKPKGFLASAVFPGTLVLVTGLGLEKTGVFLAAFVCVLDGGVGDL